jgi:hypothetical protein
MPAPISRVRKGSLDRITVHTRLYVFDNGEEGRIMRRREDEELRCVCMKL